MSIALPKTGQIHFVAIGGIGMSAIAEILLNLGYRVSGSDVRRSPITDRLASLGARIFEGHRPEYVEGVDFVVYSSAVKSDNPELLAAKAREIPTVLRAEVLGELMRTKYGIAVAGTHGKTTTTSMIGLLLTEAGLDPTIMVGGVARNFGTNARLGRGKFFVTEADEFDRSFLKMRPMLSVVTAVEEDHLDCYKDLDDIKRAFLEYMHRIPPEGLVILCSDEVHVRDLIPRIGRRMVTYGTTPQADLYASEIVFQGFCSKFEVYRRDVPLGAITLRQPGIHNVKNALGAIAVGLELEVDFSGIQRAIEQFKGVLRRFEIKGEAGGVTVIDDYAHLPTEVSVTLRAGASRLEALRSAAPRAVGRLVAIFQPHLYSRTRDLCAQFGPAFLPADLLFLTEIYPSREQPICGVSGRLIADAARASGHPSVVYLPDKRELVQRVIKVVQPGDLVITLGAGDIWEVGEEILRALRDELETSET